MDFKVFLSEEAVADLEQIVGFVAARNEEAAERLGLQLLQVAQSLRRMPQRGRIVPEFRHHNLREVIVRSFRVIYRVNDSSQIVEVVRFWHGARGFPEIERS